MKSYKVLNKKEKHHGMQYKKGLNISLDCVDPAARENFAIRWAAEEGNLDIVEFLLSLKCVKDKLTEKQIKEYEVLL